MRRLCLTFSTIVNQKNDKVDVLLRSWACTQFVINRRYRAQASSER
jgi:hypothetical protein